MQHFPTAGEIVIFDRRWYNHAGVEQVMGFSSKEEHEPFLRVCPEVQKFVVDSGIQLIKFGLEAGNEEQKPVKHYANAPASRNARVAKIGCHFSGAAAFALVPLFAFSELWEGDRHPKVNTPLGCDWRILVISHPLCRNIKVQRRQTGTNHYSTDSQT